MKKFLFSVFIFIFIFTNVIFAGGFITKPLKKISIFISEENRGDLYINGNYVDNDPVLFTIIKENETGIIKEDGGETLFPLRTIFENLGAEVNSDETGKNIEILYNGNKYLCSVFYNKMAVVSNDENLYNGKYYVIRIFDTKNNNYAYLNDMSDFGVCTVVNGHIYLFEKSGEHLFNELGFEVSTDIENRIVHIDKETSLDKEEIK